MKKRPSSDSPNTSDATTAFGRRLRTAPARELLELVRDSLERLTPPQARLVMLNPFVNTEVIEVLLGSRTLTTEASVRAALARHRKTPEIDAVRLIPRLFWRDLMEISVDLRLRPNVRRIAEKYLILRLPRLSPGEKIALARRAGPIILVELVKDPAVRVIGAVLKNPRLTEQTLLPLAGRKEARPQILDLVGKHPRWGRAQEIRFALARNPSTTFSVLFEILPLLKREELEAVLTVQEHSSIVRTRARELLENRIPERNSASQEEDVWEI